MAIVFRTEVKPPKPDFTISYKDYILLIGSCFVENMGNKLRDLKFNVELNPTGIVFNPISVCNSLNFICDKKIFTEKDLFYHDETWNSLNHHSRFSDPDLNHCLKNINWEIEKAHNLLKKSNFVFITLGTAWIFEKADSGEVVSNCHKLPAGHFKRRLAEIEEITKAFETTFSKLDSLNKNLKIIITLSPIRHLKDGLENNSLSKSILRVAIDKIIKTRGAKYFPANEILLDDLRDYRFYGSDLCHPSEQAIDYIWEKFSDTYFDETTISIIKKIEQLNNAIKHKAFHPQTMIYKQFIKDKLLAIQALQTSLPYINLHEIKELFESKLHED